MDTEKMREALERAKGDLLGLGVDKEASATLVEVAHDRAKRTGTPESWAEYEAVKKEHEEMWGT